MMGLRRHKRAALLLEVIVAMTIMITAMAFVGAQMIGGLRLVAYADQQARAGELADRMLAILELDQEATQRLMDELIDEGDFGEQYPEYMWRVVVEPLTDVEGLSQVTIEILYQNNPELYGEIDDAAMVHRLHMLKANPGRIDLAADFGIDQERIEQIADLIPIPGFDPTQLSPQALVSLDPLELMAMLPQLMPLIQELLGAAGGGGPSGAPPDLANMNEDQLRDFLLQQLGGGGDAAGGFGQPGGAAGGFGLPGGGGRGARGGNGNDGRIPTGADAPAGLEELLRLRDELNAGGGGGRPPRLTPRSGGGGRGAGARGGDGAGGLDAQTIRDLDRLRDAANRLRGGGGRP